MNTAKIHLIDPNFQSQHSGKCNLLIRISKKRLSYAIVDQGHDELKVLFDSPVEKDLKTLLDNDPFLKFHFHRVKISVESLKFTFIPKDIYSESDLDSYTHFIHPGRNSDILVKDIRSAKIKNITAFDKYLGKELLSSFTNPHIFNQANPLIESVLKHYRNAAETVLVLQFNSDSFEALIMKNNNFQYYNLFYIDSPDELNYFLLAIIRDFEIKNTDVVILSGDISENEEYYMRIQKYFSNISFADSKKLSLHSDIFKDIPDHQFFSLISLNLCE
jgi:hypothetical protein